MRPQVSASDTAPGRRAFLRFESIHYYGRPSVNGAALGEMGPYVPYEFEVTRHAREGYNEVEPSRSSDAGPGHEEIVHGLSPVGRRVVESVREVYVELRPPVFIDNIAFAYTLRTGYAKALVPRAPDGCRRGPGRRRPK